MRCFCCENGRRYDRAWKPLSTPLPGDAPTRIRVDWQELSEKNDDLAAWILTPDADYLYKICSIHQASSGSDTFTVRFTDYEEYKFWQGKMLSLSAPATGETLEYQDRVVTLSTCTENSAVRMTVQGKLIWKTFSTI